MKRFLCVVAIAAAGMLPAIAARILSWHLPSVHGMATFGVTVLAVGEACSVGVLSANEYDAECHTERIAQTQQSKPAISLSLSAPSSCLRVARKDRTYGR